MNKFSFVQVLTYCIAKCASEHTESDNVIEYGYNYNVVKLNDSTFILNPTHHNKDAAPKLVMKDSIGFYIKGGCVVEK